MSPFLCRRVRDGTTLVLQNSRPALVVDRSGKSVREIPVEASVSDLVLLGLFTPLLAVIIGYVKRGEARGTWLESHFNWQIRTFWWALVWAVLVALVSIPLTFIVIGIGTWVLGLLLLGVWAIYRVARGWMRSLSATSSFRSSSAACPSNSKSNSSQPRICRSACSACRNRSAK